MYASTMIFPAQLPRLLIPSTDRLIAGETTRGKENDIHDDARLPEFCIALRLRITVDAMIHTGRRSN